MRPAEAEKKKGKVQPCIANQLVPILLSFSPFLMMMIMSMMMTLLMSDDPD